MNMAKLGTVSGLGIGFYRRKFLSKINKMRETSYTLCVLQNRLTWNGLRHSFAVNIPHVRRIKASPDRHDFRYCNGNHNYRYCNDNIYAPFGLLVQLRRKTGTACFLSRAGALVRRFAKVAVSVPLQLTDISVCRMSPVTPSFKPYCVWLRGFFLGFFNCSGLLHRDTCLVRSEKPLFSLSPNRQASQLFPAEASAGTGGRRSRHQYAASAADSAFCVPHRQASQISEAAWRPTRQGVSAPDFGRQMQDVPAEGDNHPSEKPLLTLTLTADQLGHLAFAVYSQVAELTESREADSPEVQDAIRCLNEVSSMCIELEKRRLS